MSFTINYTRAILATGSEAGSYDINNGNHVDGGGKIIPIQVDIKASFTDPVLERIVSNGTSCDLIFASEPSAGQKTDLDSVVATYKAYTS